MKTDIIQEFNADILLKKTKRHFQLANVAQKQLSRYIQMLLGGMSTGFFILLFERLQIKHFSLFSADGLLILFGVGIFGCFEFYIFRIERRINAIVDLLREHKLLDFPAEKGTFSENQ
jgi:hypothetical protein